MQEISYDSNNTNKSISPYSDLKRRVEITRDARFQANLRLERRQKASYFAISILSLFVILLSLLPNIFTLSNADEQILLALTIVNSVFIIISTFLEASGNFVHKGEQLHRSARKVAAVYNQLMLLTEKDKGEMEKILALQKEYQLALDQCAFNHDNLDYFLIKATKPSLFAGRIYSRRCSSAVRNFRHIVYKLREYSWLIPHALVTICTPIMVIDIIIDSGLRNDAG